MYRGFSRTMLAGVFAMACSSDTSGPAPVALLDGSGDVQAVRVTGGVRVTNNTNQSVPYVVWDRGFLGLLGLGPCDESEPYCTKLPSGQSVTVREGIDGFGGYGDAAVYWYGTRGDSTGIHVVIVGGGKSYPTQPVPPDSSGR